MRLLLLLLGFSGVRQPNAEAPIAWGTPSVDVVFQEDGSDDVADGSDLTAMAAALEVWTQVACSDFAFNPAGTSASGADGQDGVNRIAFRESDWPGGADGVVAFTMRFRDTSAPAETWIESDILLNGVDYSWSTTGDVQRFDVQSVVTHELGHALGLQHSARSEATMYFGTLRGVTHARTLDPDDERGLCYLYPNAAQGCTSDADCPLLFGLYGGADLRYRCDGASCVLGASDQMGAECRSAADCTSGVCAVDPKRTNGDDPDACSRSCTSNADCGGELCDQNICFPGRDDCIDDDDCAGVNNVCVLDLDGRFRCRDLCLEDPQCGASQICHGGTGANPPGFCREPGAKGDGESCQDGLECSSLACTSGGAAPSCEGGAVVPLDGGMQLDAGTPDQGARDGGPSDADPIEAGPADASSADASRADHSVSGGCTCTGRATPSPWSILVLLAIAAAAQRSKSQPSA